jgi:hypothetical protein
VRARRLRRAALLLCALLLAACGADAGQAPADGTATAAHVPDGDWTRLNFDAARSGVGPPGTGITASNAPHLGVRVTHIDGVADSSAVVLHSVRVGGRARDVAFVTTTYGRTIAFDPGTGRKLWEFVPKDIGSYQGSAQITTATPVIDPDRNSLYSASPDGWIHKLTVAGGRQVWATRVTWDATREKIAGALNLSGNDVIAVTGGYIGDAPVYQGHVVMIDRRSGNRRGVWNSLCSNRHFLIKPPSSCHSSDSAIWARAGAVVEPDTGRLLVATGNGPFNGSTDWGDSVLELSPDAHRLLHNWTPRNQAQLEANDTDLGSTAPAILPPVHGLRLAVQGGKAGVLSLLNLNRLNGTRHSAGRRLGGELQNIATPGSAELFSAPAVARVRGRIYVFAADGSATAAYVLGGDHRLHVAWQVGTPGTSPVLAGGLLYVYDENAGVLRVMLPRSGHSVAVLPAHGGHWNSPVALGGRVILPVGGSSSDNDSSGSIYVYHLRGR